MWRCPAVLVILVGAACSPVPAGTGPRVLASPAAGDRDGDGVPDAREDEITATFAPELRLPPDRTDWTRPASVEWYLARVKLRFDHAHCPDDRENVLDVGAITAANLAAQHHPIKSARALCRHRPDGIRRSDEHAREFFLQAEDDEVVHPGIPAAQAGDWEAYVQVRPSRYIRPHDGVRATYDLQVWYFFPYNDNIAGANHEGDWEHLTISLGPSARAELDVVSAFFATHDGGHRIDDPDDLTFVDDTHLVAYVADGSHATCARAGDRRGTLIDDRTYDDGPRWRTWERLVNLGDRGAVTPGQEWALYGGRWGEVGLRELTSGPVGPMFQPAWDAY